MSDRPVDLIQDPLAAASLTGAERQLWDSVRAELIIARNRIEELEAQVLNLENKTHEEESDQPILTRPAFNREVARMLAFDERYGGASSLLLLDFENLGDFMRTHGRPLTDKALQAFCDMLAHNVRRSDILGRLDTDTFGILLARCPAPAAWAKGERLSALLTKAITSIDGLAQAAPLISYGAYMFQEKESLAQGLSAAAESVTRGARESL